MFEQFKTKAEAVGAEVHRFSNAAQAEEFIVAFMQEQGITNAKGAYAVWADSPFLGGCDKSALAAKVPGLSFEVSRELAADAKVGVSEMGWALTDTGSLVADQTDIKQRLASTLPEIHIAIIGTDRILDGKAAVFTRINPANSKFIAFITGPSRTADIERVLTIGVHGPKRLVIVFVDQMEGGRP